MCDSSRGPSALSRIGPTISLRTRQAKANATTRINASVSAVANRRACRPQVA